MRFRRERKTKEAPDDARGGSAPDEHAAVATAVGYHARTKHHYFRYARALGFLDWDTQPDPFRRYVGSELLPLPRPTQDQTPAFAEVFGRGVPSARTLTAESLSRYFYYSLALSAWKRFETAHWSLRVNPSSGNLHPSEAYALLPAVAGVNDEPGVFHYAPREHGLERRAAISGDGWAALAASFDLTSGCFLVGLTSIPWREGWKYGERAWRYCQHDAGHALAALRISAALQGWTATALPAVDDRTLELLLGLLRAEDFVPEEEEVPDLLVVVRPQDDGASLAAPGRSPRHAPADLGRRWRDAVRWFGRANRLSSGHQPWEVIDAVDAACRKTPAWCTGPGAALLATARDRAQWTEAAPAEAIGSALAEARESAGAIIRRRRSAVAMDGRTALPAQAFFSMMRALLPDPTTVPWDALPGPACVHLGLFVHRVHGLPPGLYALVRRDEALPQLRSTMHGRFAWDAPPGCPEGLPLYLLQEGKVQSLAAQVSCGQDIAGQSAFSLGMLAEFEPMLARFGAPMYRHLFWEAGVIGQVLYLQAEAAGVSSTGIGCYFDDPVHEAFGLSGQAFQSLYHFTVGGAVTDTRLTSEPAYPPPALP